MSKTTAMQIADARVIVTCPGRNFVTLRIETADGSFGLGDATLNGRELAVVSYLSDHVLPCLIGRDAHQIEDIWQFLYRGAYWRRGPGNHDGDRAANRRRGKETARYLRSGARRGRSGRATHDRTDSSRRPVRVRSTWRPRGRRLPSAVSILSVTKLRPGQVTITRASAICIAVVFDIVSELLAAFGRPLQRIVRPRVKTRGQLFTPGRPS